MTFDYPDFVQTVQPSRVEPHTGQARDYFTLGGTISAGSYSVNTITTVASGKQLLVAFANATCSKSCICRVRLSTSEFGGTYYFYDSYFDIKHDIPFPDLGTFPCSAGAVIKVELYNYGASSADFRFAMHSTVVNV